MNDANIVLFGKIIHTLLVGTNKGDSLSQKAQKDPIISVYGFQSVLVEPLNIHVPQVWVDYKGEELTQSNYESWCDMLTDFTESQKLDGFFVCVVDECCLTDDKPNLYIYINHISQCVVSCVKTESVDSAEKSKYELLDYTESKYDIFMDY